MTFDEWFTDFFQGMPEIPDHVRWGYQMAYDAGLVEGRTLIKCPGCRGEKSTVVRVQRRSPTGGRWCEDQEMPCPVCQGSGIATEEHVQRFFLLPSRLAQDKE
jgi:hypothetical protein